MSFRHDFSAMLRFEWRRLTSIRSTYVLALLAVCASGASYAAVMAAGSVPGGDGGQGGEWLGAMLVPENMVGIAVGIFGAMSIGHELRYGTSALVLAGFPRRGRLFASKLLVAAIVGAVVSLITFVVSVILSLTFAHSQLIVQHHPSLWSTTMLNIGARLAVVGAAYALLGAAIATITKSLQLGIVVPIVWANVIEGIAVLALHSNRVVSYFLPYQDARNALTPQSISGAAFAVSGTSKSVASLLALGALTVALCVAANWRYSRLEA